MSWSLGVFPLVFLPILGPRYGDFKCIHDGTHRVCAKLVDNPTSCDELSWNGNGASFWDITGQQRWNWKDKICSAPNPGDSWCICMWATANLIKEVGLKEYNKSLLSIGQLISKHFFLASNLPKSKLKILKDFCPR